MSSPEDEINHHDSSNDSEDDSNDEGSDSSEEGSEKEAGFLDVMAVEASQDHVDNESDAESEGYPSFYHGPEFSQFLGLPFELRRRVWELYCPEMRLRPRVLDFIINPGTARHRDSSWPSSKQVWTVHDGIALGDMTSATRTVLSVHSESRSMALAVLTDTLALDAGSGDALVRFNPEKDVVKVSGLLSRDYRSGDVFHLHDFAEKVKNLTISRRELFNDGMENAFCSLLDRFCNLETVLVDAVSSDVPTNDAERKKRLLNWCVSEHVSHHFTETFQRTYGFGEDMEYIYCWPDLVNHKDFAKVSVHKLWCDLEFLPRSFSDYLEQRNLESWPLVRFEGQSGSRRYKSLLDSSPNLEHNESSDSEESDASSEESHTDLDEYESDGIDDAEVLETFDDSDDGNLSDASRRLEEEDEDEEDVIVAHFSSPEAASGSDDEPSPINRNGGRQILSDSEDEEDVIEARFSSPEIESGDDHQPSPVSRGRKRRVVSDSDDEEDAPEEPATKRARTARVVLSDSEDEPVFTQASGSSRRPRAVLSDSEDDEGEGGAGVTDPVDKKAASPDDEDDSASEESDERSDSESEDSEEGDEEERPTNQLSLAERLRLHRETVPVSDDEGDSSGTANVDDGDEDEDDEEDDEEDENGYLLRMAEDESGSDDGAEEKYDYDDG